MEFLEEWGRETVMQKSPSKMYSDNCHNGYKEKAIRAHLRIIGDFDLRTPGRLPRGTDMKAKTCSII